MRRSRSLIKLAFCLTICLILVACNAPIQRTPQPTGEAATPGATAQSATAVATETSLPTATTAVTATATADPSPTPGNPPQVSGSNPIDGDLTMSGDRTIVLQFDQPMDQAALAANLVITPALEVAIGWPAPDRAVIIAAGGWTEAAYEVAVLPGMQSISGVPMAEGFQFSFETGGHGVPVPILMYHNIKDFENESDADELQLAWTVRETAFREQMYYLRDNGWQSISPSMLVAYFNGEPLPAKPVIISMDDAWVSLLTRAWPVFQETGLRPIVYVVAEFPSYGSETDYLDWEQLRGLVAEGIWIGCHSYGHVSLYELPSDQLTHEVVDAKAEIEAQLGVTLDAFSYPFGAYGQATVDEVNAAGFTSAVTLNPVGYQDPAEPFRLNRLQVDYGMTLDSFIEMVEGRWGKSLYVQGSE